MKIKTLSKARFEALTFKRNPTVAYISTEVEWYSDIDEIVIGTIVLDEIDRDWLYVVLGRDEKALFRCIDIRVSFKNIDDARNELIEKIRYHASSCDYEFPQGDIKGKKNLIFQQIAPEERLNENFKHLSNRMGYSPAKEIIQEIAYSYVDLDGNFIEQFQTTGFNPRLWELYLYAFLHESLCYISEKHNSPDYVCMKHGIEFCIEAVTVNPTQSINMTMPESKENIENKIMNYYPIKYGSVLTSKLGKRYWELEHVKDKPLILAIHDFHENDLIMQTSHGLSTYLYGHKAIWHHDTNGKLILEYEKIEKHKWGYKEIPSGFFDLPNSEYISAVLFSNNATPNKFNRMGKLAGFGDPEIKMFRVGTCYNSDPNAAEPLEFRVSVEDGEYSELWSEGLEMYHNPNAKYPIDPELFPDIAHHIFHDGLIKSTLPYFHPIQSVTYIITDKN